jgi:sugar O-acyltransferase (sialic acid O-acetyltransferase NeuD family)
VLLKSTSQMGKKLVIYGAGGFGREVKSMLPEVHEKFDLLGFLDDGISVGTNVDGVKVLGGLAWLEKHSKGIYLVIAIGAPKTKSSIAHQLLKFDGLKYPTLIHSKAVLQDSTRIQIGEGSIITAGSVLTTGIKLGNHVLINLNTTIGHDTVIGHCSSIMPGVNISGCVAIGKEVMVGSGANIINNIRIGDSSTIGAGSVVNHDIPSNSTAAGVPARIIKSK